MTRPCNNCDADMTRIYYTRETSTQRDMVYLCPTCDAPGPLVAPSPGQLRDTPKA